jgi:hypothetical protein
MALSNYAELQASVVAWLNRNDLGTYIPDFVRLAEADLNARLRSPANEKRETAFAVSGRFTALPSDFAEMRRVYRFEGTTRIELKPVSSNVAGRVYDTDQAFLYSINGNELEVVPEQACTLELTYYRTVPALASNSTNDVLTRHPDVYLFGTLMQACLWLGDGNLVAKYLPLYESALSRANRQRQLGGALAVRAG